MNYFLEQIRCHLQDQKQKTISAQFQVGNLLWLDGYSQNKSVPIELHYSANPNVSLLRVQVNFSDGTLSIGREKH